MDWDKWAAILIASLSLAVSFATLILTEIRLRKADQNRERDRLTITTERREADTLLAELEFSPRGAHTRYAAELKVLPPSAARLSEPRWTIDDHGRGFISMPHLELDPGAVQHRNLRVELEPLTVGGSGFAKVIAHAASGQLAAVTISVAIRDVATGKIVLKATETLTA